MIIFVTFLFQILSISSIYYSNRLINLNKMKNYINHYFNMLSEANQLKIQNYFHQNFIKKFISFQERIPPLLLKEDIHQEIITRKYSFHSNSLYLPKYLKDSDNVPKF